MTTNEPIGLESIDSVPLHEVVFRRLTRALMSGRIEPGRKLTLRKLAAELGTSDLPVRSALQRLQAMRALEQLPNGSMVLPAMTRDRFLDLMNVRVLCESEATLDATQHLTRRDLREVKAESSALTKAALAKDIDAYLVHNHAFKFRIYRACKSETLFYFIEMLWLQIGPFLRQFGERFDGDLSGILALDFHEEIVAHLEAGDGPAAADAIRRDIQAGARYLHANGDFL